MINQFIVKYIITHQCAKITTVPGFQKNESSSSTWTLEKLCSILQSNILGRVELSLVSDSFEDLFNSI